MDGDEVESIEQIILKLDEAKKREEEILRIHQGNLKTLFLSKLPKLIILTHILPYLTENEILKFAGVCRTIKALIYSPMGLKVLLCAR